MGREGPLSKKKAKGQRPSAPPPSLKTPLLLHFVSRLGKLVRATTVNKILEFCDEFVPGDPPEFFFDRFLLLSSSLSICLPFSVCLSLSVSISIIHAFSIFSLFFFFLPEFFFDGFLLSYSLSICLPFSFCLNFYYSYFLYILSFFLLLL